jgi:hypothetical protein
MSEYTCINLGVNGRVKLGNYNEKVEGKREENCRYKTELNV